MADLKSRFVGAILGAAVGDALGASYEGASGGTLRKVKDLTSAYRPIGGYPVGQYTDDTQLTLAIAGSLAERGALDGEDIARRFCELWRSGGIVGQGASCHEAVTKMLRGECSWRDAGTEEGRAGNGAAMRAGPLGLWFYDNPGAIPGAAALTSSITHKDARAAAGCAAVAGAVAYLVPREGLDEAEFIGAAAGAAESLNSEFSSLIRRLPLWLKASEEEARFEIAAAGWRRPEERLDFITPFVVPTVLISLFHFLKSPRDFLGSIRRVIGSGGDVDTTASITGAISAHSTALGPSRRT